jgi:uncharacterized protein (TIGR03086 family)
VLDLDPAAREVVRLLDGVNDDQLWAPTPSEDTSVARLLDHIAAGAGLHLGGPQDAAGRGSPLPSASADALDPDWRKVIPRRLGELVEAWRDPAAWEGTTQAGGVTMPAEAMGVVVLDELVLHGWDLAKATGQAFRCDPAHAAVVLEFTADSAKPENAAGRQGLFGPVVELPEDAPVFDRALGYAGRDPAWTPARARPA